MDSARARKLGERIAQIVAEMLERRVKDPRLGFATVTGARVTGDLREATVFYTVYGSAEEQAATAAALASASGLIRSEVGRQTGLKHTPTVAFQLDGVPDNARNIEELVARAREADAALAVARAGAEPAGEPDPYKVAGRPAAEDGEEPEAGRDGQPAARDSGSPDNWRRSAAGTAGDSAEAGAGAAAADRLAEIPAGRDRGTGHSPA